MEKLCPGAPFWTSGHRYRPFWSSATEFFGYYFCKTTKTYAGHACTRCGAIVNGKVPENADASA